jgi:hypothetical protein
MIIVCTKDADIRRWAEDRESGGSKWDSVVAVPPGLSQDDATAFLQQTLAGLDPAEAVCLTAHGNNDEIGDEGNGPDDWGWDYQALAMILASTPKRTGPLLIRACATKVVNFSAQLAQALRQTGAQKGLWCYGYRIAVDVKDHYPAPTTLDKNVDLQGTRV